MVVAEAIPDGVLPELVEGASAEMFGEVHTDERGRLVYHPSSRDAGLYVLGHDSVLWANTLGLVVVIVVLLAALSHATLRWIAARVSPHASDSNEPDLYLYTLYERIWHWLQAFAVLILLLTGLEIHFSTFKLFGFASAIWLHNIVGFVVVVNSVFAALFHLASGEIRQYLPDPAGFFGRASDQVRFYVIGIFRGEAHPFEKRADRKLNPLQQVVYLAILNVLLPLQMVSGLLMWGAQRWDAIDATLGGLRLLALVHALGAWLFAAFLILHLYLTTTGPTPATNLRAMITGWHR
jgi:thiosulfate reductase cytochrome b subunit